MSDENARAALARLRRTGATPAAVADAVVSAGISPGEIVEAVTRAAAAELVHIAEDPGQPRRGSLCGRRPASGVADSSVLTDADSDDAATCYLCLHASRQEVVTDRMRIRRWQVEAREREGAGQRATFPTITGGRGGVPPGITITGGEPGVSGAGGNVVMVPGRPTRHEHRQHPLEPNEDYEGRMAEADAEAMARAEGEPPRHWYRGERGRAACGVSVVGPDPAPYSTIRSPRAPWVTCVPCRTVAARDPRFPVRDAYAEESRAGVACSAVCRFCMVGCHDGTITHGRGCYALNAEGGGTEECRGEAHA